MPRSTMTKSQALIARAGRAAEDPVEMTRDAYETKIAKYVAQALKANPALEPLQAARAARLLMRADMTKLAQKSAAARSAAAGKPGNTA